MDPLFSKNVLAVLSGNGLAKIISILSLPLLSRLYSPEDIAVYGVVLSIIAVVSIPATLRFEYAIMLPKSERLANLLFFICATFTILYSFLLTLIYFANEEFEIGLSVEQLNEKYLIFIPIIVFLLGINQCLKLYAGRTLNYRLIGRSLIVQSFVTTSLSLIFGIWFSSVNALLISFIIGNFFALVVLKRTFDFTVFYRSSTHSIKRIKAVVRMYRKFPLYDLPSALLFSVYTNFLIIIAFAYFDGFLIGVYYMASKLVKVPVGVLVVSFSDVFYQKISVLRKNRLIHEQISQIGLSIFKYASLPFVILTYSSFWYSDLIFGDQWLALPSYIVLLSQAAFVSLVCAPYRNVFKVIGRQEISFYLHGARFLITAALLFFLIKFEISFLELIFCMTVLEATMHLVLAGFVDYVLNVKRFSLYGILRFVTVIAITFVNYILLVY